MHILYNNIIIIKLIIIMITTKTKTATATTLVFENIGLRQFSSSTIEVRLIQQKLALI